MGLPIDPITEAQAVAAILAGLAGGRGGWVVTPNLDQLRQFTRDPALRSYFQVADLVLADGMPLIWASRIQETPLPERVAGSSLTVLLAGAAATAGHSIFLLGGDPGVAERAAEVLGERFPTLTIAGVHCPPRGFETDPAALARIDDAIRAAQPDLIYVGLGFPKQEHLIAQLRGRFQKSWFLGIGVSLSFASGHISRAPRWMQVVGLEWMHRLTQEPRRLARRYLLQGLPFAARLMCHAALRRLQRSWSR